MSNTRYTTLNSTSSIKPSFGHLFGTKIGRATERKRNKNRERERIRDR